MNKQTHRHRKQKSGYQREEGWGKDRVKGVKYKVTGDSNLGGKHTIEYIEVVL